MKQKRWMVTAVVLFVLLLDQVIKVYVKTHFTLGETIQVLPIFQLCFVENPGMAFGMDFLPKIFLTLFRVVAAGGLIWYLDKLIKKNQVRTGYITVVAVILAGAIGNIIDCLFYGLLFGPSTYFHIATFLPDTGGYAPFLQGKVVDMFYLTLIHDGAGDVIFFRPIFNVADVALTVGVFVVLLFYHRDFNSSFENLRE